MYKIVKIKFLFYNLYFIHTYNILIRYFSTSWGLSIFNYITRHLYSATSTLRAFKIQLHCLYWTFRSRLVFMKMGINAETFLHKNGIRNPMIIYFSLAHNPFKRKANSASSFCHPILIKCYFHIPNYYETVS